MKALKVTAILLFVANSAQFSVAGDGWLKKATGIETPRAIQKIAPNGVQVPQISLNRPPQSGYTLSVLSRPYINPTNGIIMGGTTNSGQSSYSTGLQAEAFWDSSGRKFWRASYTDMGGSVVSPIRAQGGDRPVQRPQNSQPRPQQQFTPYPPHPSQFQPGFQPYPPQQFPQHPSQLLAPEAQLAIGILQIIDAATR